ncbi:hypothetical protein PHYSODRAFT_472171 [Phytophthora sojae]|uniref:Uncharacterized protein n=1 Tax=Phytophthora sojae (strain P6497) TaxID=1094619 RepID=G4YR36_PHYSP|nr:hypothetical protein PHYSODRAFT_472171 [Phytophthora sojae]EGZ30716.1 hypothetical protein PHYSODRAFT_472171 [Phytophthora sojae]|eukprot:XP_009517991.1 hypothetical protein PHYSODRAFT_472171 [Phytophthora sojae]
MIPREFFVVETNSVLLPHNYPPNQYKSTLNAQGQWETVVFPALTPNNRQQVLYLRQTLDKMRATMPQFEDNSEPGGPETETDIAVLAERRRLMVEYTSQETQIYSYCFHELARQIKCICKEQSELLHEIRERYDAAVARLIKQNKLLEQKVEELEQQMKAGPPVAAAHEAEDEIDDEEAEWRRQRDASSVSRPSLNSKRDSTKELHLAATRLQVAFQKYQARKEQTRITLRVEKQAAAMDIQRSYRGFRDRQLALHRRAVMRTILRRREENAAVELMQANVRAYLLNRRRKPTEQSKPNPRQALIRLLTTFRELATDQALPPRPPSVAPSEIFDDEDVELFQQTMQEAQALVGSLHVVLGTDGTDVSQQTDIDARSDGDTLADYDDNSINIPFGERDAMRLQNYAELHLDDSLWSSATYYPASREAMAETESLLALALSSREQRKRLVSLKQFISDIYDTIVGKLKELPPRRLTDIIASRCHLTLSFVEWRQQRSQLFSRAVAADQPGEQAMPVKFSIEEVTREHFRCRLGLPQLIDAAVASLHESINDFADIDADVKRFHEFMASERSEEELVFCCVCRYLCANRLSRDDSPAGTASSSYHRQPMFHPVTMREVIDVPHALELAKLLFRVEDENSIIESDTHFTEVENVVYRQYLPTNGYHQFEAILSTYFVDPDTQAATVSSINEAETEENNPHSSGNCRRPAGSPRRTSAMVRPTNFNQFHSKQYNAQAPRSPIPKWVYFEEVLALLIKYRGEMNHFHLFSYWLLDDGAFVATLTPLSLGPTERELRNIFHNSLRQRKLNAFMPLRVFTSVALLLLRNGLLSVSTYAPMQKPATATRDGGTRQRSLSIREENEDKEWRSLALKWRTQEAAFEAAIEAIYHDSSPATRAAHALQLLQLRQELYDLFASRSGRGRDLKRAHEIYDILVNERLARVGGDTRMLDASLGSWSTNSFSYF